MNIEELYWFSIIHEALKEGHKVTTRDINTIVDLIPGITKEQKKLPKAQKKQMIFDHFDSLATDTLQKYLVDKQLKEQQDNQDGNTTPPNDTDQEIEEV